jgi:hypothetical protein
MQKVKKHLPHFIKGVPLHQTKHMPKMLHYNHTYDYTRYDCHNPMFNNFITHIFTSLRVMDIALVIDILFSVDQAALLCTVNDDASHSTAIS